MKDQIKTVIAKVANKAPEDVKPEKTLISLGVDSIAVIDLVLALEDTITDRHGNEIYVLDDAWDSWETVGDVYEYFGVAE